MARRLCLALAALALVWALLVTATGGFRFSIGELRFSSRTPTNALLIALVCASAAWTLAPRGLRRSAIASDLRAAAAFARERPDSVATITAAALAVVVVVIGVVRGALVTGGADAYGYVSQAEGWASGTIRFDEPLIRAFAGRVPRDALVPFGYAAVGTEGAVVPRYPPGLPMVMGVFQRIGGRDAVFYAVPFLGGVAVLATFLLGKRLAGTAVGLIAATLLATSPPFLFQLTAAPMSDVAVTAWWALALALALFESGGAAFLSGIAAGVAILTRPNLVPLAAIPALVLGRDLLRRVTFSRVGHARAAITRVLWFALGVVPGCATVGALYAIWYGSPFMSGYGSLDRLYEWRYLWPNLQRYPAWVVETETPLVITALLAPWLIARIAPPRNMRVVVWAFLAFIAAVLVSYLFYEPFEAWWFVRFMLPAFPALFVLTGVALVAASAQLPSRFRLVIPVVVVAIMASHGLWYAWTHSAFAAPTERKYAAAADYVVRRLPERAALIAMQHSGSLRYYAQRVTVRYDLLPDTGLDAALKALQESGYHPYFLLEPFEIDEVRRRHSKHSAVAALDWPPIAVLGGGVIRIFDPADRQPSLAGRPVLTEIVN